MNLALKLDVPLFEDLRVHAHTSAMKDDPEPPVHDQVQIGVRRIVVLLFVSAETQFREQQIVDPSEDVCPGGHADHLLSQTVGPLIQLGPIGRHRRLGEFGAHESPDGLLQVEVFPVVRQERHQRRLRFRRAEMPQDVQDPPPCDRIRMQPVLTEPRQRPLPPGNDLGADLLRHGRIIVRQQGQQSGLPGLGRHRRCPGAFDRVHGL